VPLDEAAKKKLKKKKEKRGKFFKKVIKNINLLIRAHTRTPLGSHNN